jgi:outer membrane protein OmpA-like peptidoglycan-associated protein
MTHTLRLGFGLVCSVLGVFVSTTALAQTQTGFALDRFEPSERGSDWLANESLDFRGEWRPAVGLLMDYAQAPLVAYDSDGSEAAEIVSDRFLVHLGGALVLKNRVRIGLDLPLLVGSNGQSVATPDGIYAAGDPAGVGDLRATADAVLLGVYGKPLVLAAGLQAHVPTGSRDAYTSDHSFRVTPRMSAAGDLKPLVWAAQTGLRVRPVDREFADAELGSEFVYAAAIGVRVLDRNLLIGPEVQGAVPLTGSTVPVELLLGGQYTVLKDFRVGLGAGPGLSRGLGTPEWRGVLKLEWFPAVPENHDQDGDGVPDLTDECPARASGLKPDTARPGCPAPDSDGDGFVDPLDACPEQRGVDAADPTKRGCPTPPPPPAPPPPDADRDGVPDAEDACPKEKGTRNADGRVNGCPPARLEKQIQQIRILHRIEFDTEAATLRPESTPTLEAVLKILSEHPEVERVEIQGHTDANGPAEYNEKLSGKRARTVLEWLVSRGIAAQRLTSRGYGESVSIASNETEDGRQTNRRVEFHILREGGRDVDSRGADTKLPVPEIQPNAR